MLDESLARRIINDLQKKAAESQTNPVATMPGDDFMGNSWSGFQPQNELVKLQWALMEASEFKITAQEFEALLAVSGLSKLPDKDESADLDGLEAFPKP